MVELETNRTAGPFFLIYANDMCHKKKANETWEMRNVNLIFVINNIVGNKYIISTASSYLEQFSFCFLNYLKQFQIYFLFTCCLLLWVPEWMWTKKTIEINNESINKFFISGFYQGSVASKL